MYGGSAVRGGIGGRERKRGARCRHMKVERVGRKSEISPTICTTRTRTSCNPSIRSCMHPKQAFTVTIPATRHTTTPHHNRVHRALPSCYSPDHSPPPATTPLPIPASCRCALPALNTCVSPAREALLQHPPHAPRRPPPLHHLRRLCHHSGTSPHPEPLPAS